MDLIEKNNGEVCENLVYLGTHGIYNTVHGIKLAYLSGVFNKSAFYNEITNSNYKNYTKSMIESMTSASNSKASSLSIIDKTLTLPPAVDILLTSEWSENISHGSAVAAAKSGSDSSKSSHFNRGSKSVADVARTLQPRYHFAVGPGIFMEREPYKNSSGASHVTRFIGLGEFGAANKERVRRIYDLSQNFKFSIVVLRIQHCSHVKN